MGIREALEELKVRRRSALELGGKEAVAAQHALGRLTARERLGLLLAPGSFLELGMLARCQDPALSKDTAADGLITGFGDVGGMTVAIMAEDATVLDNTDGEVAALKRRRLLNLTQQMGWPLVFLADWARGEVKEIQETRLFGRAAPPNLEPTPSNFDGVRVAVVMGNCFGHSASLVADCDFVVMVKGASLSLLGPALDDRGGTGAKRWDTDHEATGVVDRVATDDREGMSLVREFLSYLPCNSLTEPPATTGVDSSERTVERLLDTVPDQLEGQYDMAEVIAALVDSGSFLPLKPVFGRGVITCLARLGGRPVGIAASQPLEHAGMLGADAVIKVHDLVELCARYHLPLLFIQDSPGYLAETEQERRDILSHVTRTVSLIKNAHVPKLGVILRQGFALGEFVLGGRKLGMDYLAAWPLAEVPTKEPVIYAQLPAKAAASGGGPWYAAGLAFLDDIIDPQDTRRVLIKALEVARWPAQALPPNGPELPNSRRASPPPH